MDILKKKIRVNIKFLIIQMKTKKYQKNREKFENGLKLKLRKQMVVKEDEHGKDVMKIEFDTVDSVPLYKPLKLIIIIRQLDLFLKKTLNFIHKLIETGV